MRKARTERDDFFAEIPSQTAEVLTVSAGELFSGKDNTATQYLLIQAGKPGKYETVYLSDRQTNLLIDSLMEYLRGIPRE